MYPPKPYQGPWINSRPNRLKAGYCLVMMIIISDCGDSGGGGGGGYVAGNAGIDDHGSSESRK